MKDFIQVIIMFCVSAIGIIFTIKTGVDNLYNSLFPVLLVSIFMILILYWDVLWIAIKLLYSKKILRRK